MSKFARGFFVALILMACLCIYAVAETWTCPKCGTTGLTDRFCINCAAPSPTPGKATSAPVMVSPTPNSAAAPTEKSTYTSTPTPTQVPYETTITGKTYVGEATFLADQVNLVSYKCEDKKITVTFDKALSSGSRIFIQFYTKYDEYIQTDSIYANGTDSTFIFSVNSGWKKEGTWEVNIYQSTDITLLFQGGVSMHPNALLVNFVKLATYAPYRHVSVWTQIPDYRANMNEPISHIMFEEPTENGLDSEGVYCVYLYHFNSQGQADAQITVYWNGNVSVRGCNGNNLSISASDKNKLEPYREYANDNMPIWKNGGRLLPKYQK